jgi:hypothetical protein
MRSFRTIIVLLLASVTTGAAAETPQLSFDRTVDRVVARANARLSQS